jgi:putative membrane protein|nr:hypothetical protein [Kofleriaceae bacterium]
MRAFLTDTAGKAFHEAIIAIERASSAEVVVVARPGARASFAPHASVAVPLTFLALVYTLYSETEFPLWQLFAWPLAAGVLGFAAVAEVGAIYRAIAPRALRKQHVLEAARAMFYARGVHATTKRTGVLVYIALRERVVELVGDVAFVAAVDGATRRAWAAALTSALPDGVATGRALGKLADDFAAKLPHRTGDTNELADDVVEVAAVARHPRGKRTRGAA